LKKLLILLLIITIFSACNDKVVKLSSKLEEIELAGDLSQSEIEASSLAWYNDNLIILPQFPHKWDSQYDGAVYFIPKEKIENYISGKDKNAIIAEKIHFSAKGLDKIGKSNGSGYEAITFVNDTVYVSIESINSNSPSSYIVMGKIDFDKKILVLDTNYMFEIKSQTNIHNMGEETIFSANNSIYSIHEANGINANKSPFCTKLDKNLNSVEKISMPQIDFRITDATNIDSMGIFYVINYYYPGEAKKPKPNITDKKKAIEQILELQLIGNKIVKTDKNPLIISNQVDENGHNWEGIVKFNSGFLLISDMFPKTILAYYR